MSRKEQITCVLLRHGKTQGNIEKRYIGKKTDEPLLDAECCSIKKIPDSSPFEPVFVSPLRRCLMTAELLLPENPKIVIEELAEMDFGSFEGKNYEELKTDPRYQAWIDSNGTLPFPDGEDQAQFAARSFSGFKKALEAAAESGSKKCWIVAHGGTVMSVMSRLTGGAYYDFMVQCKEGYEIVTEISEGQYDLVSYHSFSAGDRA